MDIRFCYRISASAGMAHDSVTGEDAECYSEISLGSADRSPDPEEYKSLHEDKIRNYLANQVGLDPELLTPISIEEYDQNVEED